MYGTTKNSLPAMTSPLQYITQKDISATPGSNPKLGIVHDFGRGSSASPKIRTRFRILLPTTSLESKKHSRALALKVHCTKLHQTGPRMCSL